MMMGGEKDCNAVQRQVSKVNEDPKGTIDFAERIMRKPILSKDGWLASWGLGGQFYNMNRERNVPSFRRFGEWPKGKEIWVLKEGNISQDAVDASIDVIRNTIDLFKLELNVKSCRIDEPFEMMIRACRWGENALDSDRLGELLYWRRGTEEDAGMVQHAEILLTDKILRAGGDKLARAEFREGYVVMPIQNATMNDLRLMREIMMHEIVHLLGAFFHHEEYDVTGYGDSQRCLMNSSIDITDPVGVICDRCKDAVSAFWYGLEKDFGISLVK